MEANEHRGMNAPVHPGKSADCVHPALDTEIRAVGGHYSFLREARIRIGDDEILYFVGAALMDSTCCGAGGCGFASVQGVIERYRYRRDETGNPVSRIRPVTDPETQKAIESLIKKQECVQQVLFI